MAEWWHRLPPVVGRSRGINSDGDTASPCAIRSGAGNPACGLAIRPVQPPERRQRPLRNLRGTLLVLALTAAACTGKHDRVTVQNEEETTPQMASLVRMNDPKASAQMLNGFYALENNSWRWTSGKFSVLLRTPPGAAAQGAVVTFAFSLPDIAIQKLKSVAITASVNGTNLKTAEFDKPGANIFTADVPPPLLTGESVKVDFALDKTLPQEVDKRILGVVATSVGISSK